MTVAEAKEAAMNAAHAYAIAEGSGGDTSDAQQDMQGALDDLVEAVRNEVTDFIECNPNPR